MTDVTIVLRGELQSLEAELAADPRYQKITKIRELLAMYGSAAQLPGRREMPQPAEQQTTTGTQSTKAERIRSEIEALIRVSGIVHRREMLDRLVSLGIMGRESSPMASLAAYLSEMKESIVSHGGGKWGFRDGPIPTKIRSPRKISGARPESLTTAINQAAAAYLRQKGSRAEAPEIRQALIDSGFNFANAHKGTLASCLSHSRLFDNIRGQGYGLLEWLSPKPAETETPNSGELSGAPKGNGALPLNL
jgi:hypothetical protein